MLRRRRNRGRLAPAHGAAILLSAAAIGVACNSTAAPRTTTPVASENGPFFGDVTPLRPLQEPSEPSPTGGVLALRANGPATLVGATLTPQVYAFLTAYRCGGRFITRSEGWEYLAVGPPYSSSQVHDLHDYATALLQGVDLPQGSAWMGWISAGTSEDSADAVGLPCVADFDVTNAGSVPIEVASFGLDIDARASLAKEYSLLDVLSARGTAPSTGALTAAARHRPSPSPSATPTPTPTPTPSPTPAPTPTPTVTSAVRQCFVEMGRPCVTPSPTGAALGISTPNTGGCAPVAPLLLDLHSATRSVDVSLRGESACGGIFLPPHTTTTLRLQVRSRQAASYGVSPHLVVSAGGTLYDVAFEKLLRTLRFLSFPGNFTCWEFAGENLVQEPQPWGLCL